MLRGRALEGFQAAERVDVEQDRSRVLIARFDDRALNKMLHPGVDRPFDRNDDDAVGRGGNRAPSPARRMRSGRSSQSAARCQRGSISRAAPSPGLFLMAPWGA